MKITFLGTGAADWTAEKHRDLDGYRRNSSLLIDDCLLIDPGSNVPDALDVFGKDGSKITFVINTHRHTDHFCQKTLDSLENAEFFEFSAGDERQVGKYTVSAFAANHSTCREAVHFIISDGEKKLFYGLDGAWLLYDEIAAIKSQRPDYAVLDATVGDVPGDYRIFEHNNLDMVLIMQQSLKKYVGKFCISHMARTLHGTQSDLEKRMETYGIDVAFDGMETEI